MKYLALAALTLPIFLATPAGAQGTCAAGATCVPPEDVKVFIQLLKDQKCRSEHPPTFEADPIVITEDEEGRVYGSGDDPKPWKLHMKWCGYDVTAEGNVKLTVAKRVPPEWGFRFRPKFSSGVLLTNLFRGDKLNSIDVGVLWEVFYWKSFNLNVATGFRSAGAGIGADITRNFAGYIGYAVAYDGWASNPYVGLSFSFW